jgi:hypothetical protein
MRSKQERRGKQNASNKKLQLAMVKAEKAPEAEGKRRAYLANRRGSHYLRLPSRRVRKGTPSSDSRWLWYSCTLESHDTKFRFSKHLLCGSYNALSSDYIL